MNQSYTPFFPLYGTLFLSFFGKHETFPMLPASLYMKGGSGLSFKEQLAGGDEEALSALMDTYGGVLMRTAVLLVKDKQLAEEVVQDTFVTAFQKIHQLESDEKLKGWLVTITVNGCRSRMRTWSWRNLFTAKDENVFDHMEEDDMLPEAQLLTAIENEELHEAVQSLPYSYREPIALFYFHDMTLQELADTLDLKLNTIKTRLARGRTLLRETLMKGATAGESSKRA